MSSFCIHVTALISAWVLHLLSSLPHTRPGCALVSYCVALLLSTENGITIASRRGVEYFRLQKTSGSTRQIKTKIDTCTQTPPRNTLRNNYLPCSFLTFDLPFLLPYLNGGCEKPAAYNQVEQIYTQVHSYLEAACNDACCVAVPKGEASGSEAAIKAVLSLWKEVEYYREYQQLLRLYLGEEKAAEIIKEALYLISIGTNDFMENYFSRPEGRALEFGVEQYQNYLIVIAEDFIIDLYNLGDRKLSLGGLPSMGCLPLERTTNVMHKRHCVEAYNNVAKEFNWKLENLVDKLNHELIELQLLK